MMSSKGHRGTMGWPGGDHDSFPKWAIDIINFRNKKIQEDYLKSGYKLEEVDIEYEEIDTALTQMSIYCSNKFEDIPIETIEKFIRKKKLKNLNNK
jgi:hypothetical protein